MGGFTRGNCFILHHKKDGCHTKSYSIDKGSVQFGVYKLWIFKDGELYFKDSIENIFAKRVNGRMLIRTRDDSDIFEIIRNENE